MDLWEDREVRFDVPISQMKLRPGEKVIDRLDFVEDTKGNGGDKGRLIKLRGTTEALYILTKYGNSRFEFIFTNLVAGNTRHFTSVMGVHKFEFIFTNLVAGNTRHFTSVMGVHKFEFIFTNLVAGNTRHFTSVMGVHKAYISSRIYRDMKLRVAVVRNKQLRILPLETIYNTVEGVWNLSSDQVECNEFQNYSTRVILKGNLGSFIISNIRVVWYAEMNENFNVSLPYICIASVRIRESKFGPALVVESNSSSGGYVLGFRIDPLSKLQSVSQELASLYTIHTQQPEFGVQYTMSVQTPLVEEAPVVAEEVQEVEEAVAEGELTTSLATYSCQPGSQDAAPVYCPQIGLAVQPLRPGYTLTALWQVIPPQSSTITI